MSDRRVLAVSAACITAAIFFFLLGTYPSWKAAIGGGWSWRGGDVPASDTVSPQSKLTESGPQAIAPASPPIATPASIVPAAASLTPTGAPATPAQGSAAPASAAAPAVQDGAPSFDIVRVEPNGDSVVAARAKAGAKVVLLDQGHPIASAQADASGQVAFVPPTLAPGEHSLMLSIGEPDTPGALSSQSVAVSVPVQSNSAPLVALLQPDQPTRVLSGMGAPGAASAGKAAPSVAIGTIDVEEMGSVYATGHAAPGSQCRIYLNGSFVANVNAAADGTWALKIKRGMKPGHYSVRIDQLASAAGDVQARAEVPFDYPAQVAAAVSLLRPARGATALPVAPLSAGDIPVIQAQSKIEPAGSKSGAIAGPIVASAAPAQTGAASDAVADSAPGMSAVVTQLLTTKVTRGDSLWRISRKILGHGRRYTQIYAANTGQIRDPRLIYPGQIFVMPQTAP